MSKNCKKHPGQESITGCLNCEYGKYINNQIKKGNKSLINPEVLKNHKRTLL